jgi:hypothetical protein
MALTSIALLAVPAVSGAESPPRGRSCLQDILDGIQLAKSPGYDYNTDELPFRRALEDKGDCVKFEGDRLPGGHYPPPDDQIVGTKPGTGVK